jgi:riboflavin biosynthesis pyrimidine reductase
VKYGAASLGNSDCPEGFHATVQNDDPILDSKLALRHARAMLAVLLASKAEQRAESKTMGTRLDEPEKYHAANKAWARAGERYRAAVARLERIEKKVRCG